MTRRLLTACGFALAITAAPTVVMLSAAPIEHLPQASCASGEDTDVYTGDCQPIVAPNTGTQQGPDYSGNFSEAVSPVDGANPDIPEIDGIPCTGMNSGQCIGLSENQVPDVSPHSTVSSSP